MQIYIDDILILSCSVERLTEVVAAFLELLRSLGVLFHPGKCILSPTPSLDFLGLQLDIPKQLFKLTEKQRTKLKSIST